MPIPMSSMAQFCELYEMTIRDLHKIIAIEEIMYPSIAEKTKQAQKDKEA